MGGRNAVISSDLRRRQDGGLYANQRRPDDPGIAVYFEKGGESVVMAQDAFIRPEENVRSLTLAISGLRQVERHGGGVMMKRAFAGFTALPPPDAPIKMPGPDALPRPWHDVLGVSVSAGWSEIRTAYRDKMRDATDAEKLPLNLAYEQAKIIHQ